MKNKEVTIVFRVKRRFLWYFMYFKIRFQMMFDFVLAEDTQQWFMTDMQNDPDKYFEIKQLDS